MIGRWRIFVAVWAALAGAGTAALAQEAPPPADNAIVGPPQLQDFSLNGTVTRATREPTPVQEQTRQPQPSTTQPPASTASRPEQAPRAPAAGASAPAGRADAERRPAQAARDELPPPTPASRVAAPSVRASESISAPALEPEFDPASAEAGLAASQTGVPVLPWLIAALAVVGGLGWYFLRQRPRESYAGGGFSRFDAPTPSTPAPRPAPPRARAAPAPQPTAPPRPAATPAAAPQPQPAGGGIVSTRLRPWLELEFKPQRGIVDEQKAAIAFELSVFNSGSVPARDVLLEASLFNAGPMQDQQIRLFFENPVAKGDRIPVIPPLQRVTLNTAVFLPREQVRPIEVEGRALFVPMLALNALYGWGKSGSGQTSASYLVGKSTSGEKLAPFRVDLGPRVFRNLDSREHELRLRS